MKFLKELVSKDQTTECFEGNGNIVVHSSTVELKKFNDMY